MLRTGSLLKLRHHCRRRSILAFSWNSISSFFFSRILNEVAIVFVPLPSSSNSTPLMDRTVLGALQNFVDETVKSGYEPEQISSLNLSLTSNGYLTFSIQNRAGQKYILVLPTYNKYTRSITECNAYIDALIIGMPGTYLTQDTFDHFVCSLKNQYSRVSDPIFDDGSQIAAIMAGVRPERPCNHEHRIVMAHLLLEDLNLVTVIARTHSNKFYALSLRPAHTGYGLCAADCRLLRYALFLLRRGTILPPQGFLAEALFFRETCPSFKLKLSREPEVYQLIFNSSVDDCHSQLPHEIYEAAANSLFKTCPWFFSASEMNGLTKSPYPFISLGEKLRLDPEGEIFFALRRFSPCAVRIFAENANLTTFFGTTVKQLLILEPHPNLVNVFDYFLEPRPAILLDDMRGESLSSITTRNVRLDEKVAIRYSIGIAEGLTHLHANGFVHHELGLFNIYVYRDVPKLSCLEFGWIDQKTNYIKPIDSEYCGTTPEKDSVDHTHDLSVDMESPPRSQVQITSPCERAFITKTRIVSYADRIDVACFGVMLWEMVTGCQLLINDNRKMNEARLQELIFNRKDELIKSVACTSDGVREVIEHCWCANPMERWTMTETLENLKVIFNNPTLTSFSNHIQASDETSVDSASDENANDERIETFNSGDHSSSSPDQQREMKRDVCYFRARNGSQIDAFENFERRYPDRAGSRIVSNETRLYLNERDCHVFMNVLENRLALPVHELQACYHHPPRINLVRRQEAFSVLGDYIMKQLDKGFSTPVDCFNTSDVFNALTMPYRGVKPTTAKTPSEKTHLRLVLSYRHEHPVKRRKNNWSHRQRIEEADYRTIAVRVSRYACSLGARTVAIWTDQHFAGTQSSDSWGNNCLLPYIIYPVIYFEKGCENENRLWICAEHQLAISGEGIISEIEELPGLWRKTKRGAVAGKLLPLSRGLTEATSCLLPNIHSKQTYHSYDRDDIIAWTRAISFFGYNRDIWKTYKNVRIEHISAEIAGSIMTQGFSPTWVWNCHSDRWKNGAVLRTCDGSESEVINAQRGWHGLWNWVQMDEYKDSSEMFATVQVEMFTRATVVESGEVMYGFVFLIGRCGQLCRSCVVQLEHDDEGLRVKKVHVLSEHVFTMLVRSLQKIACLKEIEEKSGNGLDGMWRFLERGDASYYPAERVGCPSLDAINDVLNTLQKPALSEMRRYQFFDGHEIEWH